MKQLGKADQVHQTKRPEKGGPLPSLAHGVGWFLGIHVSFSASKVLLASNPLYVNHGNGLTSPWQ